MATKTHALDIRNLEYIRSMKNSTAKYLIYLSTLSRFHRYRAEDIPSFVLEAPQSFSAVMTKDMWNRFGYEVDEHAKGVSLVRDGETVMSYDISEVAPLGTESRPIGLWQYDDVNHRAFLDAVVPGKATTQEKIIVLSRYVADHSRARKQDKPLVAASIAAVVLERLGQPSSIPVSRIASMNLANLSVNMEEIASIVQEESRPILDGFREIAMHSRSVDGMVGEQNPFLSLYEPIDAGFPPDNGQERAESMALFDSFGNGISFDTDTNPSAIEVEVPPDDADAPEEGALSDGSEDEYPPTEETAPAGAEDNASSVIEQNVSVDEPAPPATEYGYYIDMLTGDDFPSGYIRYDRNDEGAFYGIITYPEELPSHVVAALGLRAAGPYRASEEDALPAMEEAAPELFGYGINLREASPSSLPASFVRVDRDAPEGIFGTVWYASELTEEQQFLYGLLPVGQMELDLTEAYAYSLEELPRRSFASGVIHYDHHNQTVYFSRKLDETEMQDLGLSYIGGHEAFRESWQESSPETTPVVSKESSVPEEVPEEVMEEEPLVATETETATGAPASSFAAHDDQAQPGTAASEPPDVSLSMEEAMSRISGTSREKEMFRDNIRAILTLKSLSGREATEEEKEILRKYHSFGGLAMAFDAGRKGWESEYQLLQDILTPTEYIEARKTVLNAYFTDHAIIQGIYRGLAGTGFSGGRILEPSMGVGAFLDAMPEEMREGSSIHGIELDTTTGAIAKALHPESDIQVKGFEKASFGKNAFDLAVSNVPFGDYGINDAEYNKHALPIHDYFIMKMLDETRPSGITAVITSHHTMDKLSENARRRLFERGELLRAIRLPDAAFRNAGTSVTTDILIFRKRQRVLDLAGSDSETELPSWIRSVPFEGDSDARVNAYFLEHPEQVIGELTKTTSAHGFELACKGTMDNIEDRIADAFQGIGRFYVPEENPKEPEDRFAGELRPLSFQISGKNIIFSSNGTDSSICSFKPSEAECVRDAIAVRDALREVIDRQVEGINDDRLSELQQELDLAYESYVGKHGRLRDDKTLARLFAGDASYRLLLSLEVYGKDGFKGKAPIFTERTINAHTAPTSAENAHDALAISLQEKGMVDLGYMSILTDRTQQELISELYEKEIFFDYDKGMYVTADEYLSGDIREKIDHLEERLARIDQRFMEAHRETISMERDNIQIGIDALKKVLPPELSAEDIHIELGSTWIPVSDYQDFIRDVMGTTTPDVQFSGTFGNGLWKIQYADGVHTNQASNIYGTDDLNGIQIMESLLNLRSPKVYRSIIRDGKEKRVIDQKATFDVQQKAEEIKAAFRQWIWSDEDRRQRLVAYYNRYFNNIVPREFNGDNLLFPGMNPSIKLRKHQRDAIARTLYGSNNALFGHSVGAGKTFEIAASAMEAKRLGLAKKNIIVVPKHLTEQFGSEFLQLYPNAKVLVATQKDFKPENRKEFCAKIATQNWDAVIMSFEQFEKIPISKKRQQQMLMDEINKITRDMADYEMNNGRDFTVKQGEKTRNRLAARLDRLSDIKQDPTVTFEALGCDRLYVDEAHNYKNLFTYTKLSNIPGISTSEAQKSLDMYLKCNYLNTINHGRCGIIFATGTSISNSMTELYTLQRYLDPDSLRNLKYFDAWASTFGKIVTSMELAPEGKGFRLKERFAQFNNLPELMSRFREFADIKMPDQLHLDVPEAKKEIVNMEPSDFQKEYVESLAERAKNIRSGGVSPEDDNMLLITNDGRKLALDQRLIDPDLPDDPNSKVNHCVQKVLEIHAKHPTETQLIFCDMSTPSNHFNVYDEIKQKLIQGGLRKDEVAFVQDAKNEKQKDELFARVRSGKVKVLLGSTSTMGTGTNVQDHLVALHDLDIPWRPSDLEQRMGRIVRQGNKNENVEIYRYVTEGTFDAYLWQIIENKQRFISQVLTSKTIERSAQDVDEATLSFAEIKAIATGNPLIKEKMDIDMEIARLRSAENSYHAGQERMKRLIETLPECIRQNEEKFAVYAEKANEVQKEIQALANAGKTFSMEINGVSYETPKGAADAIRAYKEDKGSIRGLKGRCLGMDFSVRREDYAFVLEVASQDRKVKFSRKAPIQAPATIEYIESLSREIIRTSDDLKAIIEQNRNNLESAQEEYGKPFPKEKEMQALMQRSIEIDEELQLESDAASQESIEMEKEERKSFLQEGKSVAALEDPAEKVFCYLAGKHGVDDYNLQHEMRIISMMVKQGIQHNSIVSAIVKRSPLLPDAEKVAARVSQAEQLMSNQKAAAR